EHDPLDAFQQVRGRGYASHATADLDLASDGACQVRDDGTVVTSAERRVEVHHVEPRRAEAVPVPRRGHRVVVVDGLAGGVALEQPDGSALLDVDGGDHEEHQGQSIARYTS